MDICKLKFTRLQNEILRLLAIKVGISLNARDIARALKVSPTAISKSLELLKEEELVTVVKYKLKINLLSIELNRDNQKAIDYKRTENLKMIYESGLPNFLENIFPGATIILFGSYSYGEDFASSDIDLAVIGRRKKDIDLDRFEKLLKREIRINFYDNLKEIHKNLRSNILNGITLVGSIEL